MSERLRNMINHDQKKNYPYHYPYKEHQTDTISTATATHHFDFLRGEIRDVVTTERRKRVDMIFIFMVCLVIVVVFDLT